MGKCNPPEDISDLRRDALRKLALQLILASKRFWPKWLRNGKGSLRRRRAKEGNGTFEVPRKTLATRACLLETGNRPSLLVAKLIGVAWGSSSHPVTLKHDTRDRMAFTSKERRPKSDKEQQDAERDRLEAALDAGLEATFPVSDAVAVTQPAPQRYIRPNN